MLRRARPSIPALLAVLLLSTGAVSLFTGAAHAQTFGRVSLVVTDPDGNPMPDVQVVVTCDELTLFRQEATTNKKGKATISVTDATKVYNFHLEHPAYPEVNLTIKPQLRSTVTREVVLSKGRELKPGEQPEGGVIYTAAEKTYNEGVVALQAEDFAAAEAKFREALEKDSKLKDAHSALAGLYLHLKDYQKALASVDAYIELDPDSRRVLRIRYEALKGLGREDEADAALETLKARDQGGDTVAMIYNEGVQSVNAGDLASGKARFLEALELDPNLAPAYAALAQIYFRQKEFQGAVEMADKHLELAPGDVRSLRVRWDAYRGLGDEAKAAEAKKALAAANPDVLVKEAYNMALDLFNNGDTQGAIVKLEEVVSLDPDHARAHYHLGVSQVSAGDMENAKIHLLKFLELAPDDPEAQTAKDMLSYLN